MTKTRGIYFETLTVGVNQLSQMMDGSAITRFCLIEVKTLCVAWHMQLYICIEEIALEITSGVLNLSGV